MEVYKKIKNDIFWICLILIMMQILFYNFPINRDVTDGEHPSGMALRIDAETGCQYLEGTHGGMIKRLNSDGEHICQK